MTEAHPSAEGASGQMIPQTHHLVTINHPQHPHFIVSILHLCDSLFVWCGEAQDGIVAQEEAQDLARRTGAGGTDGSAGEDSRTSKVSEAPLARLSLEERRQLEVDHQMDKELANAMQSAGRQEAEQVASIPKGSLAKEWAVAMIGHSREEGSSSVQPMGTSIFRTPADVALPMSRRLACRLEISQLHLSLSLPRVLLSEGNMPAAPGQGSALLALERGIDRAISAAKIQRATTTPPSAA